VAVVASNTTTTRSSVAVAGIPKARCPTCAPGGKTFTEQVHTNNSAGTNAFKNPLGPSGSGPRVRPGQQIEVVCRFLDPNAAPSVQPGWWYLVDSSPWNREYFTPANSYLNGGLPEGPYTKKIDERVPVC
jgi:hypothetical protein